MGIWHIDALFDGFGIVWGGKQQNDFASCVVNKIRTAFPSQQYCGYKSLSNTVVISIHHEIQRYIYVALFFS